MRHLILSLHFLALTAGAASIGQALMIRLRFPKPVVRTYVLFLLSTWLILLALTVDQYGRNTGLDGNGPTAAIVWILQAVGGLLYIGSAPFFYHSLMGLARKRWNTAVYLAIDALAIAAAAAYVAAPAAIFYGVVLNSLLFAMIGYGLVLIGATLRRTADATLRRALLVFLLLSLGFFPLMWADAAVGWIPALSGLAFLSGFPFPLYFLSLNCLSIAFGLRYLDRPAYMESGKPTPYFIRRFGITPREAEVIEALLEGASGGDVADRLFISAKTVENHVSSIYAKVGARNRVQLFRLIRSNASEEPGN